MRRDTSVKEKPHNPAFAKQRKFSSEKYGNLCRVMLYLQCFVSRSNLQKSTPFYLPKGGNRVFCNKCGNEIVGDAKFCSKCGQPLSYAANSATNGNVDAYTLTINRAKQWYLVNPAVKIVVDGGAEYKIDSGETLNIPVSPGAHNIAFSCSILYTCLNHTY